MSNSKEFKISERRKQAVQLRLAGLPWQEIADRIPEYSSAEHACMDVKRARDKSVAELNSSVEELRSTEVDRLDRLQAGLWAKAIKGDTKAVDSCLRIITQRAKLLGLEAPTKIDLQARIDVESQVVIEVIMAVVDSLGLEPAVRREALETAQNQLVLISGGDA